MVNDNNSERIERYLTGQMTLEESEVFLADLKTDKALREEAQMMAMMFQAMNDEQEKLDAEVIEEVRAERDQAKEMASSRARRISLFKWAASIAAVVLVIFGVTQFYKSNKSGELIASADSIATVADSTEILLAQATIDEVFNKYYSPYQMTVSRGADDEKVLKELAELYNKVGSEKDLAPVIEILEEKLNICHPCLDENKPQGNNFEYAKYKYYENDIAWYLALAYLKNNEKGKAEMLLNNLAADGNAQAESLLKELEGL